MNKNKTRVELIRERNVAYYCNKCAKHNSKDIYRIHIDCKDLNFRLCRKHLIELNNAIIEALEQGCYY